MKEKTLKIIFFTVFSLTIILISVGLFFGASYWHLPSYRYTFLISISFCFSLIYFIMYPKNIDTITYPFLNFTAKVSGPLAIFVFLFLFFLKNDNNYDQKIQYFNFNYQGVGKFKPANTKEYQFFIVKDSSGIQSGVLLKFSLKRPEFMKYEKAPNEWYRARLDYQTFKITDEEKIEGIKE